MQICETLKKFYNSVYFILFSMAMILLGHCAVQEILFGSILVLTVVVGCFICDDARFLFYPCLSFLCIATKAHNPVTPDYSKFYFENPSLTIEIVLGVLLFSGLVVFAVRNRKLANDIRINRPLFITMALLWGAMALNGLGSQDYIFANFLYSLTFLVALIGIYLYFSAYLNFDESIFDYFMLCCVFAGLTIALELGHWVFHGMEIKDGSIVKESVMLGWGFWTTIGAQFCTFLPACFYFARNHKYGFLGYFAGILELGCIVLAQSRGGLLYGLIVSGISVLVICFSGRNRHINRMITLTLLLIGGFLFWMFRNDFYAILHNYVSYGFSDNGRAKIWKKAWDGFLRSPIFGIGFYDPSSVHTWKMNFYPYFCHNTILQFFSSGGIVAGIAYLIHRLYTVILTLKDRNPFKTFAGLCILGMLLFSFTDVTFFITYPTYTYTFFLILMERSSEILPKDHIQFVKRIRD